ncbi:UNVERIFIED_CONTAM: putative galactinol--sucrose galactosyltransferase 2 [Sesamum angustifolium]|uniref:Galactinol--sucrose galactosyltransferase 2 n=1 Tax=Sesamum angustifolium TaxID=2727405 RepID=A0AAW2Q9R5_9LAMI
MTITAIPVIKNGCLMVRGKVVLTGVPDNVVVSPTSAGSAFIGANSTTLSSRHVFNLGVLEDCKFMCLFLAKIWWMIPRVGKSASEIPMETQMLLLEAGEESLVGVVDDDSPTELANDNKFYVLVLPVLDGAFRATLQGTPSNELQFCYESGDPEVQTSQALEGVFVNSGDNPFELIKDSIKPLLIWIGLDGAHGMLFTLKLVQMESKRVFRGSVSRVPKSKTLEVTLGVLQCEIFTLSPVKVLNDNIQFAPIGLIHMYNSGGAVEECSFKDGVVRMKARGWGLFGAYSSVKPSSCKVDSKDEDFSYRSEDGLVTVNLQGESSFKEIEIAF